MEPDRDEPNLMTEEAGWTIILELRNIVQELKTIRKEVEKLKDMPGYVE